MNKFINLYQFMQQIFDNEKEARQATEIGQGILKAKSVRLTDVAAHMKGTGEGDYKKIQRFLKTTDPREVLWRLFQEEAEFVIGDPTEIERPQAWKTPYVGTLKDGKTKGFWAMVLATPYRGRAIPCGLVTYSSKTIADQADSRNQNHFRAFAGIKEIVGERPIVLDREFSYLELLLNFVEEKIHYVIRLNMRSNPPKFYDQEGNEVSPIIFQGESKTYCGLWYRGQVKVNLVGIWKKGFTTPLWVMTDLEPELGKQIFFKRMKIEESFRDLKSILGMTKTMNKQQAYMEKMLALLFIVYSISFLLGEAIRDFLYSEPISEENQVPESDLIPGSTCYKKGKKWSKYSGLFVLIKRKWKLSKNDFDRIFNSVLLAFIDLVLSPVPTHV
jgi:hypothetical protein